MSRDVFRDLWSKLTTTFNDALDNLVDDHGVRGTAKESTRPDRLQNRPEGLRSRPLPEQKLPEPRLNQRGHDDDAATANHSNMYDSSPDEMYRDNIHLDFVTDMLKDGEDNDTLPDNTSDSEVQKNLLYQDGFFGDNTSDDSLEFICGQKISKEPFSFKEPSDVRPGTTASPNLMDMDFGNSVEDYYKSPKLHTLANNSKRVNFLEDSCDDTLFGSFNNDQTFLHPKSSSIPIQKGPATTTKTSSIKNSTFEDDFDPLSPKYATASTAESVLPSSPTSKDTLFEMLQGLSLNLPTRPSSIDLASIEENIDRWKRGKEKNLRLLLTTLDKTVWREGVTWEPPKAISMVTPDQVRLVYRKIMPRIHPDKWQHTSTQESILYSNLIFCILNEAWESFKFQHKL